MDKIKYVRLELPDGSFSQDIPLSVDASYVEMGDSSLGDVLLNQSQQLSTTKNNIQSLKDADASLEATIDKNYEELSGAIESAVTGSPKGSYSTAAALIAANPATGLYVIEEDGHVYSWTKDASEPIDLGIYRAEVDEKLIKEIDYYSKIYNAMPKVEGTNIDLTLEDTAEAPMKINLCADTSTQFTTTGKNLCSNIISDYDVTGTYRILDLKTGNNKLKVSFIDKDTSVDISGISFGFSITENPNAQNSGYVWNINNGSFSSSNDNKTVSGSVRDAYASKLIIYPKTDNVFNKLFNRYYIQIELGETVTPYEPYTNGASPNPDYPQDIHVVKGDNEVFIENKNLFKIDNYVKTGWIITIDNPLKNMEAGTYTISCQNKYVTENKGIRIYFSNEINGDRVGNLYTDYTFGNSTMVSTQTLTQEQLNAKYMILYPNDDLGTPQVLEDMELMIQKGTQATPYTEHKEQNYPLNLGSAINLFNKKNAHILNVAVNGQTIQTSASAKSIYIAITGGKTYTISKVASARLRAETTIQTPAINVSVSDYQENDSATSLTIQTSASAKYLLVYYYLNGTDTISEQDILNSLQIEEGNTAHSYTPYGEIPIEMCNINNYADEFFKNVPECEYYDSTLEEGKWYKLGKIGKVVLDGSEEWGYNSTSSGNYRYYLNQNIGLKEPASTSPSTKALILSNKFKAVSANDTWVGTTGINTIESITQYPYARLCLCYINENTNTTVKFKNWLSTNNPIVYYPLETPTKTLLSDTLQTQLDNISYAMAYQDQTNISQNNEDRPFVISVSAIMDLDSLATRIAVLESEE